MPGSRIMKDAVTDRRRAAQPAHRILTRLCLPRCSIQLSATVLRMRVAVFGTARWVAVRLETRVREGAPAVASCGRSDALP